MRYINKVKVMLFTQTLYPVYKLLTVVKSKIHLSWIYWIYSVNL